MRFTDIDWREVLNDWSEEDIEYLMEICREKLEQIWMARLRSESAAQRGRNNISRNKAR
ncbi:MAG: hypothetical protein QHG98_07305 [Methanothrix sp.]|jgi:hypothetical protein|nr:hypothetical protein [Methanothrix sp.]